jgi:microcystin-dependent protein
MNLTLTNDSGDLQINFENYRKLINPCGMIVNFSGDNAPNGWLICDGSEISKTTYSHLFAVIGTKYGSASNSNNFKLPDLGERIPSGYKSGTNSLGNTGGNSSITLTTGQMPSHTHSGTTNSEGLHNHTASDSGHNHTYNDAYFAENQGGGANNVYGTGASTDGDNSYIYRPTPTTSNGFSNITVANNGSHTHTFTSGSSGNGESIDIRNKFIVLNYIIKY